MKLFTGLKGAYHRDMSFVRSEWYIGECSKALLVCVKRLFYCIHLREKGVQGVVRTPYKQGRVARLVV